MKLHGNAALSWSGRRRLAERVVEEGWTVKAAAAAAGVSVRCARKWAGRYRAEGEGGLVDRSSAPRRVANRTPAERVQAIVALRQLRMSAAEIAETLAMALSTVSGILTRLGLGRLGRLGLEPPHRYERTRPGELVHVDVKQLVASRAVPASASPAASSATRTGAGSTPRAASARQSAGSTCT
jgi:transposase